MVPENIHTQPQREFHLVPSHLPGFSIIYKELVPPPTPPEFPQSRTKPPPAPLEKFIFMQKD